MQIGTEGVEDARIPFTGIPDGATVTASLDREVWVPVATDLDADGSGTGTVLLAGYGASGAPAGTPVVPLQGAELFIRIAKGSEIIVRSAGDISVF